MRDSDLSDALLPWYDANARVMPWRVGPLDRQAGARPNPYHVWLSEVMLQQTTVATVKSYFRKFTETWPTLPDLAAAEDPDVMAAWAGLGYYARARNLLKCARAVTEHHAGRFPRTRAELLDLPGIGPYTAAAIAAIAFDEPAAVVDGNVERVMARLHAVTKPMPTSKKDLIALAERHTPERRPGDYAQAVMDLGATICTPRRPACGICPLMEGCKGRAEGIATDLPAKLAKKPKPTRHGVAWLARREDGAWLLETRPDKGLLGGMLGWPGSEWHEDAGQVDPRPPIAAGWIQVPGEVRHTFTHFHLKLALFTAVLPMKAAPGRGTWMDHRAFQPAALPTVMRKAYDLTASYISSH